MVVVAKARWYLQVPRRVEAVVIAFDLDFRTRWELVCDRLVTQFGDRLRTVGTGVSGGSEGMRLGR